jgi:hypothetical protein
MCRTRQDYETAARPLPQTEAVSSNALRAATAMACWRDGGKDGQDVHGLGDSVTENSSWQIMD